MARARKVLEEGYNLGFFPEGGILAKNYPEMVPFKEGAFRIAVENKIPIIPITFPDNHKVLADDEVMNMKPGKCRIIYHKPVYPSGTTEDHIRKLQKEVFRVIQSELYQNNQPANQKVL